MARKDVDLVIRAKDEAEGVVKSITKALNSFIDAQQNLQKDADGTEGALRGLGSAVGQLDKAMSSLKAGDGLSNAMRRAADSVDRLEAAVKTSATGVAQLERRLQSTTEYADRFSEKTKNAKAALDKQTASVSKATKATKALQTDYRESVASVDRLEKSLDRLPDRITKANAAFEKSSARVADLRERMASVSSPTKTLTNQLKSAENGLETNRQKVDSLNKEYQTTTAELEEARAAVYRFGAESELAARNLARQEVVLGKIALNLKTLKAQAKAASAEENRLANSVENAANALSRQQGQLERAQQGYVDLAQSAEQMDAALSGAARVSRGNLESQLVEQGIAAREARIEAEKLQQELREYSNTALAAGPPTREVSRQLQFLGQRANEAEFKLMAQEETLDRMGAAYRETGNDLNSLTQTQARFIAAQDRLGASMQEVANDGLQARQAIRALHQEADKATASLSRAGQTTREAGNASRKGAKEVGALAQAYRELYGDTRRSLSYTQRLRGEVLSLVAAYGGFYGVIEILSGVVDAYQVLEAAQSRLGVALDGDTERTADEMDFLRRTAERLGVSLGDLSTEYSKFAIATKGTNLEGANTRKIFVSVAEAARVNRSSTAEMSGVFTALTQIVSKGAVQMEELRQQLGDRLPGALSIMADGLGVTTGELIKMMEAGEVSSDALVQFSEELDRRFGPGLNDSLQSTTVAIGRLQNAVFNAMAAFGQAGFIDAFTDLTNKLTELLQSSDFQAFAARVSSALGSLLNVLGVLADNFDLVVAVGTAFLGLKLAPALILIATRIDGLAASSVRGAKAMLGFGASARGAAGGATAAAAGVGRLTVAMRALMTSTGVGLIIAAVSAGIGLWAAKADSATEALDDHQRIVDEVRNAYDAVGGSVEEWKGTLDNITKSEAEANLRRVEQAAEKTMDRLRMIGRGNDSFWTNFFGYNLAAGAEVFSVGEDYKKAVREVIAAFEAGEVSADDLVGRLDEVNQEFGDGSDESLRYGETVVEIGRAMTKAVKAIEEAGNVVKATGEDTAVAQEGFDELGNSAKETAKSLDEIADEKAAKFKTAMREMAEGISTVNRELEYLEASEALQKLGDTAIRNVTSVEQLVAVFERLRAAQDALDKEYIDGALSNSLVDRIIGVESGGDPNAKNPLSSATGLGQFISSTWLEMFRKYFPDRAASMSEAAILELRKNADVSRQMVELYMRENAESLQRAGIAVTDANLYLAHFLGAGGAKDLISAPRGTVANNVLGAGQIESNRSILDGKTREEVLAWAQRKVGISEEELSVAEAIADAEQERLEAAREAEEDARDRRKETEQRLADGDFEIEQQRLINAEKEREAAIRAAIREARAENEDITDAEIARIREQTGALYDLENAQEAANAAKERAAEAEELVNNILAQRQALQEQFEIAQETGNTALQEQLRLKMAEINAELIAAIENARALWEVVGGSEADTAIAKLDSARASAEQFGRKAEKNYLDWSKLANLFVTGLANAFDTFAQKVEEGESKTDAAREAFLQFAADFLRQIAIMILQQAIFNALKSAFGGTSFGNLIGIGAGHTGGTVGSSRVGSGNQTRRVNPAVFAGAARYHTGGLIGLRPNEVPIIAERNEEMLTRDDPRHVLNGGKNPAAGAGQAARFKIVNVLDGGQVVSEGLNTAQGEEAIMNFIRTNAASVRAAIEE